MTFLPSSIEVWCLGSRWIIESPDREENRCDESQLPDQVLAGHDIVACDNSELSGPPDDQHSRTNPATSDGAQQRTSGMAVRDFLLFVHPVSVRGRPRVGPIQSTLVFRLG